MVDDLRLIIQGKDPRQYEARWWDMVITARQSLGGIGSRAIAGIENALLDIKAKALGISCSELLGGPTRDKVRVYWSHCGSSRVRHSKLLGTPPIESWNDITALGKEVVAKGYTALKTNVVMPGKNGTWLSGFDGLSSRTDETVPTWLLRHIETLIGTFRDSVGPDVDIILDLNYHFKPEACMRIAKVLEPYHLLWLELDRHDPASLRQIKDTTSIPICSGEGFYYMQGYLPYLQMHSADIFMIDACWNGVNQSKKIGDLAEVFQHNVAPHNFYSHLASFVCASLCASLSNVAIMEMDVDDLPLRNQLITATPEVKNGYMTIPRGPGWGADIVEEVARAHPWKPRAPHH
jgi:L-alanine-DL-glutamate epimerase-like enolase superfamily enzyme